MKKTVKLGLFGMGLSGAALAALLAVSAPRPAAAQDAAPLDRAGVERIVRDYLLAHPDILTEIQASLERKQQEEQRVAAEGVIAGSGDALFDSASDGIIGNAEASKTVVEFYDYNCGYCRHALADMQAMTAADPDLRFVMKEFPILGPDSQKAHVVSMAFHELMPEKYSEFHQRLLGAQGRATEAAAMEIALSLGADEAKLRQAMKDPAISETFNQTYALAEKLAITGTPSYVIGKQVVFGALGREVLNGKIAEALKACGSTTNC